MVKRQDVPSAGGGLPAELTSFVGRRAELAEIKRLTSEFRLVTLCGAGGVGKTRLARRVAANAVRAFPDGTFFVDLTGLGRLDQPAVHEAECDLLAQLVAAFLGLRDRSPQPPIESLCDHLATRCLLLVLDNCEHLLPACAALAHALLRTCPDLRIVATSREPLGLVGEVTYPVRPLPAPDPAELPAPADALGSEAVALFTARATAVQPGFRLTAENRTEVADICHRLDGLPLAIELAAARLRVLTPAQISARLADRFTLLSRGSRTAPDRQQTLRGCVDWSFELCWKPEQRLWARLSVFAGSFELDAIEGICAGDDLAAVDLLDLTAALIDKSILSREDHGPVVRYRMLETIRAYGQDKLRESGEYGVLRQRHRDFYEQLVERASAERTGDRQAYWLDRLDQERANLRAAVAFCLTEPGEAKPGNAKPGNAKRRNTEPSEAQPSSPEPSNAEPGEAERALRIAVCLPELYWRGHGAAADGRRWLSRALARSTAPTAQRARALLLAGRLALAQGDRAAGEQLLAEGEDLARRLGDDAALAFAAHLREAVELLAMIEPRAAGVHSSDALWAFGVAAWRRDDSPTAAAYQLASLRLIRAQEPDDPLGTALCLAALAWAESSRQPERAAVLLGAADTRWSEHGTTDGPHQHLAGDREAGERPARRTLGEPAFREAYGRGQSLSRPEALAFALGERRTVVAPPEPADHTPLTRREEQVAALVARGLSNRDIAKALVISQRTAESHIANIMVKQGFTARAQIATWIAERAT